MSGWLFVLGVLSAMLFVLGIDIGAASQLRYDGYYG